MQQTTHIVLIAITYNHDTRKICNALAGTNIPNALVGDEGVRTHILNEYPTLACEDVQIYSVNDFMELNNNEEYHPDEWFMSYVYSFDWNTNH